MKFGRRIHDWAVASGERVVDYRALKTLVRARNHTSFFKLLLSEVEAVDACYRSRYERLLAEAKADGRDPTVLLKEIHTLYEYGVWNLLAIEKIVKKHDKNSPRCKVKGRVHNYVSNLTFLFAHLERSELFLLAPVLTEEMPATSAGEAHHCNICLCDVPHAITMDCNHSFCLSCASELSKNFFTKCPTCRASGSMNPIRATANRLLGAVPNSTFDLVSASPPKAVKTIGISSAALAPALPSKPAGPARKLCGPTAGKSSLSDAAADNELVELKQLVETEKLYPDFLADMQQTAGVSEEVRADLMRWLYQFSEFFGFAPVTYATAASMVDMMLAKTLVKPEHGDLVGMACLLIAAKLDEPEDLQPTLRELSLNCGGAFSESDIERMEGIVERKLAGPFGVIPFDYVDPLLDFLTQRDVPAPVLTAAFEKSVVNTLLACYHHYELQSFRPATLALATTAFHVRRVALSSSATPSAELEADLCAEMEIPAWDFENCIRVISRTISADTWEQAEVHVQAEVMIAPAKAKVKIPVAPVVMGSIVSISMPSIKAY